MVDNVEWYSIVVNDLGRESWMFFFGIGNVGMGCDSVGRYL